MSWIFLWNAPDKKQVIEECIKPDANGKCIKHSCYGNELWTLWENASGKFIVLFLLDREREGNWGYKTMHESCGPCYYKCPLAFLAECPVTNQNWREKVLAYHEEQRINREALKEVEVGKYVRLKGSKPSEFRVTCLEPFLGVADNDRVYKLVRARVIEVKDGPFEMKTFRLGISGSQIGIA
jgi:hypothetical protein